MSTTFGYKEFLSKTKFDSENVCQLSSDTRCNEISEWAKEMLEKSWPEPANSILVTTTI